MTENDRVSFWEKGKKPITAIITAGLWIALSEFARNEWLFRGYWISHYQTLGLNFETLPVNGVLWLVWSFVLAAMIGALLGKFSFRETLAIAWVMGFVLMWITVFNLQVLPLPLLIVAVPLSLLEVAIAEYLIRKISP